MKRIVFLFALNLTATTGFAAPVEYLMNSNCNVIEVYLRKPDVMRNDVRIYFDGLLEGASTGRIERHKLMNEYSQICADNPDLNIRMTLARAREAAEQKLK